MFRTFGDPRSVQLTVEEEDSLIQSDSSEDSSDNSNRTPRRRLLGTGGCQGGVLRRQLDKCCCRINNRLCLLSIFLFSFLMISTISRLSQEYIITANETNLYFMRINPFLDTYLRPGNESCLICPTRMQDECQGHEDNLEEGDRFIVYFITSSPGNAENREVIRSTWAPTVTPRPVFITGYTSDLGVMDQLVREAHQYQDIIIEDFQDSYRNLTIKTAFILKQFLRLCPTAEFLVKTDDDMFIQPTVLQEVLRDADPDQLTGELQTDAVPYRNPVSKYFLPSWLYNETTLPTFVSGWTYVLPGRRVHEILEASFTVPMINLEDVFISGLVAGRTLNLTMVDDKRFRTKKFKGRNICLFKPYAAYHRLSPKTMRSVWPRVQNLTSEFCDKILAKIGMD